jgi:hypothetical protein
MPTPSATLPRIAIITNSAIPRAKVPKANAKRLLFINLKHYNRLNETGIIKYAI